MTETDDCSSGRSVTLLVFLSAPAWARVVAADLRFLAAYRLRHGVVAADARRLLLLLRLRPRKGTRLGRLRPRGAKDRPRLRRGIVEDERRRAPGRLASRHGRFFVENRPQPPEVADDFLVHALFHRLE